MDQTMTGDCGKHLSLNAICRECERGPCGAHFTIRNAANNHGGSTDYYKLPRDTTDLQDLIEHRQMNFAQGNIFKAAWCLSDRTARQHSDKIRDLNKIIWFAQREIDRYNNGAEE